jgi:hypothetical protein
MMKVVLVKVQPGKESGTGYDFTALKSPSNPSPDAAPNPADQAL